MYLIVGLGNPGQEYAHHRHNIGFMAVDRIAGDARFHSKFQGQAATLERDGEKLWLLKPHTFMNCSGRAVQAAMAFYKIAPERIIVIYDELDLPLGKVRIRKAGGANGHNGIKDIDATIGPDYWRVRIGIGHPGDKDKVHGYVLGNFTHEEVALRDATLTALANHLPLFWRHSPEALMSKMTDTLYPNEKKPKTNASDADKAAGNS